MTLIEELQVLSADRERIVGRSPLRVHVPAGKGTRSTESLQGNEAACAAEKGKKEVTASIHYVENWLPARSGD